MKKIKLTFSNAFLSFVVVASLFVVMFGCSVEYKNDLIDSLTSEDANIIGVNYLRLEKGMYHLDLSKHDAMKLGISEADYNRMINEMATVNSYIVLQQQEHPETKLNLVDPKNFDISKFKNRNNTIKTRSESGSSESGSLRVQIQPYDQSENSKDADIPKGIGSINVSCSSVGFLQLFNFKITAGLGTEYGSGIGILGAYSGTITPPSSGVKGTFYFKTSNSYGGSCTFYKN